MDCTGLHNCKGLPVHRCFTSASPQLSGVEAAVSSHCNALCAALFQDAKQCLKSRIIGPYSNVYQPAFVKDLVTNVSCLIPAVQPCAKATSWGWSIWKRSCNKDPCSSYGSYLILTTSRKPLLPCGLKLQCKRWHRKMPSALHYFQLQPTGFWNMTCLKYKLATDVKRTSFEIATSNLTHNTCKTSLIVLLTVFAGETPDSRSEMPCSQPHLFH